MDASILVQLLAARLPPDKFRLNGLDIQWLDPADDTPENAVIVQDVVANYAALSLAALKSNSIEKVKALRAHYSALFPKDNPGLVFTYHWNFVASTEFLAGRPLSVLVTGMTAEAHLTQFGSRLGMTAAQFAAYIINENSGTAGLAVRSFQIEDEYLRLVYGAMPAMTAAQAAQAVIDYTAFCEARKP